MAAANFTRIPILAGKHKGDSVMVRVGESMRSAIRRKFG